MNDLHPPIVTKRKIKRIAPLQLGKVLAVLYGIMGLLLIPFCARHVVGAQERVGMMAFGVPGFMVLMPVIYAAMAFVFGALGAVIYNLVAKWKWIGGIEVEVE